ncbi:ABC transporter substrate-binding protein [Pseudodesulfovibrio tunisiensis]|uniref:ABC transporter substrate-binding protein n=1 Tax=Pseudodesulfovibrio tunisiensis TaxID=463192 RepID=UPI001FB3CE12|nr:ABC transporter substrate-binding protein [Pseudodesulfovibrio tunisiensis]
MNRVIIHLAAMIFMLAGCGDNTPILIGFSGQLTGKNAILGVHGRNGAQLAVETINKAGGINGRPLKLLAHDDGNTPEGAVQADGKLIQAGVVAIIGHMTSSQALAASDFLAQHNVVMISPSVTTTLLTQKKDFFFRLMNDNSHQAGELADYARFALDMETAITVADIDNKSYTYTFTDEFSQAFLKIGGKTLTRLDFSSKNPNWPALVRTIIQKKPDGVVISSSAKDAAALIAHMNSQGATSQYLSGGWAYTDDLLTYGGEFVEGMVLSLDYAPDNPDPDFIRFKVSYRNRFGSMPNFAAAFSYEAVLALAKALELNGAKREGLAEALMEQGVTNGIVSDFRFDEYGDVQRNMFIIAVQEGNFHTVEMR